MRTQHRHSPTLRRLHPVAPALAVLVVLSLSGCGLFFKSRKSEPVVAPGELIAPRQPELGRIISLQPDGRTALVEFVPHYQNSHLLAGRALLARNVNTLEETAQLVASPHQRGRIIGVYVISGRPSPGDEVVIVPEP